MYEYRTLLHRISLTTTFDAAHRVVGHRGKCARLHGHTYQATVEVGASALISTDSHDPAGPAGFVVDFADIKAVLNAWDHATLLWKHDPMRIALNERNAVTRLGDTEARYIDGDGVDVGVIRLPFNPTSENMARYLAELLAKEILSASGRSGDVLVRLSETASTFAEYRAAVVPTTAPFGTGDGRYADFERECQRDRDRALSFNPLGD